MGGGGKEASLETFEAHLRKLLCIIDKLPKLEQEKAILILHNSTYHYCNLNLGTRPAYGGLEQSEAEPVQAEKENEMKSEKRRASSSVTAIHENKGINVRDQEQVSTDDDVPKELDNPPTKLLRAKSVEHKCKTASQPDGSQTPLDQSELNEDDLADDVGALEINVRSGEDDFLVDNESWDQHVLDQLHDTKMLSSDSAQDLSDAANARQVDLAAPRQPIGSLTDSSAGSAVPTPAMEASASLSSSTSPQPSTDGPSSAHLQLNSALVGSQTPQSSSVAEPCNSNADVTSQQQSGSSDRDAVFHQPCAVAPDTTFVSQSSSQQSSSEATSSTSVKPCATALKGSAYLQSYDATEPPVESTANMPLSFKESVLEQSAPSLSSRQHRIKTGHDIIDLRPVASLKDYSSHSEISLTRSLANVEIRHKEESEDRKTEQASEKLLSQKPIKTTARGESHSVADSPAAEKVAWENSETVDFSQKCPISSANRPVFLPGQGSMSEIEQVQQAARHGLDVSRTAKLNNASAVNSAGESFAVGNQDLTTIRLDGLTASQAQAAHEGKLGVGPSVGSGRDVSNSTLMALQLDTFLQSIGFNEIEIHTSLSKQTNMRIRIHITGSLLLEEYQMIKPPYMCEYFTNLKPHAKVTENISLSLEENATFEQTYKKGPKGSLFACGNCGHLSSLDSAGKTLKFQEHVKADTAPVEEKRQIQLDNQLPQDQAKNTCDVCQLTCRTKLALKKHMLGHDNNDCDKCSAKFAKRRDLVHHLRDVHLITVAEKYYICKFCPRKFSKKPSLYVHYTIHKKGEEKVCLKCGIILENAKAYDAHMDAHRKKASFTCHRCGEFFARQQQFKVHLEKHDKYKCKLCSESFSSHLRLTNHKSAVHSTPYKPPASSSTTEPGKQEKDSNVTPTVNRAQQTSGLSLSRSVPSSMPIKHLGSLSKNESAKENNPIHSDQNVNRYFGEVQSANNMSLKPEKNPEVELKPVLPPKKPKVAIKISDNCYRCKFCGLENMKQSRIVRHARCHINRATFVCEICNSAFNKMSTLREHRMYRHNDERKFSCRHCRKTFKTNNALNRHVMTVHSSSRNFRCHCGKTYKRPSHLRRHYVSSSCSHQNQPPVISHPSQNGPVVSETYRLSHTRSTKLSSDKSDSHVSYDPHLLPSGTITSGLTSGDIKGHYKLVSSTVRTYNSNSINTNSFGPLSSLDVDVPKGDSDNTFRYEMDRRLEQICLRPNEVYEKLKGYKIPKNTKTTPKHFPLPYILDSKSPKVSSSIYYQQDHLSPVPLDRDPSYESQSIPSGLTQRNPHTQNVELGRTGSSLGDHNILSNKSIQSGNIPLSTNYGQGGESFHGSVNPVNSSTNISASSSSSIAYHASVTANLPLGSSGGSQHVGAGQSHSGQRWLHSYHQYHPDLLEPSHLTGPEDRISSSGNYLPIDRLSDKIVSSQQSTTFLNSSHLATSVDKHPYSLDSDRGSGDYLNLERYQSNGNLLSDKLTDYGIQLSDKICSLYSSSGDLLPADKDYLDDRSACSNVSGNHMQQDKLQYNPTSQSLGAKSPSPTYFLSSHSQSVDKSYSESAAISSDRPGAPSDKSSSYIPCVMSEKSISYLPVDKGGSASYLGGLHHGDKLGLPLDKSSYLPSTTLEKTNSSYMTHGDKIPLLQMGSSGLEKTSYVNDKGGYIPFDDRTICNPSAGLKGDLGGTYSYSSSSNTGHSNSGLDQRFLQSIANDPRDNDLFMDSGPADLTMPSNKEPGSLSGVHHRSNSDTMNSMGRLEMLAPLPSSSPSSNGHLYGGSVSPSRLSSSTSGHPKHRPSLAHQHVSSSISHYRGSSSSSGLMTSSGSMNNLASLISESGRLALPPHGPHSPTGELTHNGRGSHHPSNYVHAFNQLVVGTPNSPPRNEEMLSPHHILPQQQGHNEPSYRHHRSLDNLDSCHGGIGESIQSHNSGSGNAVSEGGPISTHRQLNEQEHMSNTEDGLGYIKSGQDHADPGMNVASNYSSRQSPYYEQLDHYLPPNVAAASSRGLELDEPGGVLSSGGYSKSLLPSSGSPPLSAPLSQSSTGSQRNKYMKSEKVLYRLGDEMGQSSVLLRTPLDSGASGSNLLPPLLALAPGSSISSSPPPLPASTSVGALQPSVTLSSGSASQLVLGASNMSHHHHHYHHHHHHHPPSSHHSHQSHHSLAPAGHQFHHANPVSPGGSLKLDYVSPDGLPGHILPEPDIDYY